MVAFPPHSNVHQIDDSGVLVDIPDHWAAVEKYAEDYYAGGDVRPSPNGRLDPHHIGLNDGDQRLLSPDEDEQQSGFQHR